MDSPRTALFLLRPQKPLELRRQRGFEMDHPARLGMLESQNGCMQRQPFGFPAGMGRKIRAISVISQHRMADLRKMDPNLVASPRFQRGPQICRSFEIPFHPVMGDCQFPFFSWSDRVTLQPPGRGHECFESSFPTKNLPSHDHRIFPLGLPDTKLVDQRLRDPFGLPQNQQSRGIAIKTMHRNRPGRFVPPPQISGHSVYKRFLPPRIRLNAEDSCSLIDHDQEIIFMNHPEAEWLRMPDRLFITGIGIVRDVDDISPRDWQPSLLADLAIQLDQIVMEQSANFRTGTGGQRLNQLIQPPRL